jgi:hypothetical protein
MSGGGSVQVNFKDLAQYGLNLNQYALSVTTAAGQAFGTMASLTGEAFETFTKGGVFAEATVVSGLLNHHMSDFQHFVEDASKGIAYTGAAAQVIAASYSEADLQSGASIDDVRFAFGDAGIRRPHGLPKDAGTQTFSQQQQAAGGLPAALSGDPRMAVSDEYHPGYASHTFADGSWMTTTTTQRVGPNGTETVTETVICDANGKVLRRTSQSDLRRGDGTTVSTTTRHDGDDKTGVNVSTAVTRDPTGKETIVTTTQTPDGKTSSTTSVVQPDQGQSHDADAGPIQHAEDVLKTDGSDTSIRHLGPGF